MSGNSIIKRVFSNFMPWAIVAHANYIKLPWCDHLCCKSTFIRVNCYSTTCVGSHGNLERKNLFLWDDFQSLLFETILSPSAGPWHIPFQMQQQSRCAPCRPCSSHFSSWVAFTRVLNKTGLPDVFDFSSDPHGSSTCHCFLCSSPGLHNMGCFHPKLLRFGKSK